MPSIRDMNQSTPNGDFFASLENEGGPWGQFGWGGRFPHRGPFPHSQWGAHQPEGPPGPPPPPQGADNEPPQTSPPDYEGPHTPPAANDDAGEGASNPRHSHPHGHANPHHPRGPHGHGPEFRRGCPGRRGGWGGRHRGPPPFGGIPFAPAQMAESWRSVLGSLRGMDPANLGNFIAEQIGNAARAQDVPSAEGATASNGDFKPLVDVFDTETAFVAHVSLPGAKKEDVGVSWDSENSELIIGGVVYRPGDEEFLKTLAMDERVEVGAFERKVRLGTQANPASVDVDAIFAKLEDGILRIEVPKLDKDYVEIKKVDVE